MHDRSDWGDWLRARRRALGLRQDEVAALAGVSTRSVHALEAGKATVRLDVLTAVAAALGVDVTLSAGADTAQIPPAPPR